jgi:predicted Fe-Mo cluster-binding NifX family protein
VTHKSIIRIAVASSDGKVVNQHFGAADQFFIFGYDGEKLAFLETRKAEAVCVEGKHDNEALAQKARLIGDCGYVIGSRIGPGAVPALFAEGIRACVDADFIESALEKLKTSGKLEHVLKKRRSENEPGGIADGERSRESETNNR